MRLFVGIVLLVFLVLVVGSFSSRLLGIRLGRGVASPSE